MYACMNNAQETRNTNVRTRRYYYYFGLKTRTGIVHGGSGGGSPIPGTDRQSRKGFNIYFPLLFINILAKESIFFLSRTVTAHTPFII